MKKENTVNEPNKAMPYDALLATVDTLIEKYTKQLRDLRSWNISTGHIPQCQERYETASNPLYEILEDLHKLRGGNGC